MKSGLGLKEADRTITVVTMAVLLLCDGTAAAEAPTGEDESIERLGTDAGQNTVDNRDRPTCCDRRRQS